MTGEIEFTQYVLFFAISLIFTLLAIERKTYVTMALATVSWFSLAGMNLAVSVTTSVMQTSLTVFYFGLGLIFLVFTVASVFETLKVAAENKQSVDYV
jgi:hypothetical protein